MIENIISKMEFKQENIKIKRCKSSLSEPVCQICKKSLDSDSFACFACNGVFHLECYRNLITSKIKYCPVEDCQKIDTLFRSFSHPL